MQIRTTEKMPLLDEKGRLTRPSYATTDLFTYNKEAVKRHFSLKEWEFYQINNPNWILQITLGHTSYVGNVNLTLIELPQGKKTKIDFMKVLPTFNKAFDLGFNPDSQHDVQFWAKNFSLKFEMKPTFRRLSVVSKGSTQCDVDLLLNNSGDSMCIATPFSGKKFYYNFKKDFLGVSGKVIVNGAEYAVDADTFALVDSGRGCWPYSHEWYWGNCSTQIDGHTFAFNIGWGFGNTECATENMLFVDGVAHKLEMVSAQPDTSDYMKPWQFTSSDGRFEMTFKPLFDNFTETDFKVIHNRCHQVFGLYSGTAILDDSTTVNLVDAFGFCEHAVNRW